MGISAKFIRELGKATGVVEHVVVEANDQVFQNLCQYAESVKNVLKVTPIFGFWEDVLPTLPAESFEGVLFDPYGCICLPSFDNLLLRALVS